MDWLWSLLAWGFSSWWMSLISICVIVAIIVLCIVFDIPIWYLFLGGGSGSDSGSSSGGGDFGGGGASDDF